MEDNKYFLNIISAFGNSNILMGHINTLQEDIKTNKEFKLEKIDSAHHFAAWLRLYCELISNDIFYSYYRLTQDETVYDFSFNEVIKSIRKYHKDKNTFGSESKLDRVRRHVDLILDLRHCFQHGGMPNHLRKLKTASQNDIDWFLTPSNYEKVKKHFASAYTFSDSLPKYPAAFHSL